MCFFLCLWNVHCNFVLSRSLCLFCVCLCKVTGWLRTNRDWRPRVCFECRGLAKTCSACTTRTRKAWRGAVRLPIIPICRCTRWRRCSSSFSASCPSRRCRLRSTTFWWLRSTPPAAATRRWLTRCEARCVVSTADRAASCLPRSAAFSRATRCRAPPSRTWAAPISRLWSVRICCARRRSATTPRLRPARRCRALSPACSNMLSSFSTALLKHWHWYCNWYWDWNICKYTAKKMIKIY